MKRVQQDETGRVLEEARKKAGFSNGPAYMRKDYLAIRNPWSCEETRFADLWYLQKAIEVLIKELRKVTNEDKYHCAIRMLHGQLEKVCVEFELSPESIAKVVIHHPKGAYMDDEGTARHVNTYWHLPPEQQDPYTRMYCLIRGALEERCDG